MVLQTLVRPWREHGIRLMIGDLRPLPPARVVALAGANCGFVELLFSVMVTRVCFWRPVCEGTPCTSFVPDFGGFYIPDEWFCCCNCNF